MKRAVLLLICLLGFGGCATLPPEFTNTAVEPKTRKFLSFRQVYPGMTREEVEAILGKEVIIGYEARSDELGQYKPITLANPHQQELVTKGSKSYEIDYYFFGINEADDKIAEDELMPLVFLDKKLIGMGWEYVRQEIKKP
jgi:hypothetical protein